MPENLEMTTMSVSASAVRPLLGLTVLVVEDSRFASEAVRLLCIRSGARIRRADSLTSARRHLSVYRPAVVVVDLGLPDGSGLELIESLARADETARPIIFAISGDDTDGQSDKALASGADEFLLKPFASVSAFQQLVLSHMPADRRPTGPRLISDEIIKPDILALSEDLSHLDDLLEAGPDTLSYVAPFLQGLARLAEDSQLKSVADALIKAHEKGQNVAEAIRKTRAVIQDRIESTVAV